MAAKINIPRIEALGLAADAFIDATKGRSVIAFNGEMGAGKTTFIAEVCRRLGVDDDTSSPTFAIINEYESATSGEKIYHFDCYRLESAEEAFDLGAEDILDSGSKCFIEWPENLMPLLPDDTLFVEIKVNDDGSREITF